jgi:hypothetical protein
MTKYCNKKNVKNFEKNCSTFLISQLKAANPPSKNIQLSEMWNFFFLMRLGTLAFSDWIIMALFASFNCIGTVDAKRNNFKTIAICKNFFCLYLSISDYSYHYQVLNTEGS